MDTTIAQAPCPAGCGLVTVPVTDIAVVLVRDPDGFVDPSVSTYRFVCPGCGTAISDQVDDFSAEALRMTGAVVAEHDDARWLLATVFAPTLR